MEVLHKGPRGKGTSVTGPGSEGGSDDGGRKEALENPGKIQEGRASGLSKKIVISRACAAPWDSWPDFSLQTGREFKVFARDFVAKRTLSVDLKVRDISKAPEQEAFNDRKKSLDIKVVYLLELKESEKFSVSLKTTFKIFSVFTGNILKPLNYYINFFRL